MLCIVKFQPPLTTIIKQLPRIIGDKLSRNSSNNEVFNTAKTEYEEALERNGYSNISL